MEKGGKQRRKGKGDQPTCKKNSKGVKKAEGPLEGGISRGGGKLGDEVMG